MMALAVLFVLVIYLAIAILVVRLAARAARKRGIAGWHWGLPAALVMYLLVFWDLIPTYALHPYYCGKYAGLTVYKTPQQWRAEHPGEAEKIVVPELGRQRQDGRDWIWEINSRFDWITSGEPLGGGLLTLAKQQVVDRQTGEIMAEVRDVKNSLGNLGVGYVDLGDYKFWMDIDTCRTDRNRQRWFKDGISFSDVRVGFKQILR